jgi:hypothetical protein
MLLIVASMLSGIAGSSLPGSEAAAVAAEPATWNIVSLRDNDLLQTLSACGGSCRRFDDARKAVESVQDGSAVLILADGYPDRLTAIDRETWDAALRKRLRLYIEYPSYLADMQAGAPRDTKYERVVVTSEIFGDSLRPMRIALLSNARYVPVDSPKAHLVIAKVAGVDTAVFGLEGASPAPLLFEHPCGFLVATGALSHFIRGRYLPSDAWRTIWETILARLQPGARRVKLHWTPSVRPSYESAESLPAGYEAESVRRCADWIVRSRALRHPSWPQEALHRSLVYNTVRPIPDAGWQPGDGSFGVLEGLSSTIHRDGSQPMRYAVRNDCSTEVAMLLAFDASLNTRAENARRAARLIDYIFNTSGLASGPRSDPANPAYGLVGWALDHPVSYWGDDNARALLAVGAVAAISDEPRWNRLVARCILANLRTTGRTGFREQCVEDAALQSRGWKPYWNSQHVHYSPHMQSWIWACYLWAYQQNRFEPLLERSKAGLQATMQAYPARWDWILRSGTIERARLLLPLAWLVRVQDTAEHRQWLDTIAKDLIALQDESGALRETIGDGGPGIHSNAEFGTRETSLIQADGDPVCDLLYSCNFALIGLHEAALATGNTGYSQAEDRLAQFLARIQTRSERHPELDGAWYRALDFKRWEYWASSGDWEWGPWCLETGWSQPWIAGGLALRSSKSSLWDLLQKVDLKTDFETLRSQMLPNEALAQP